ncbi:MAG: DUF1858 domain-containing protein [Candidatus ainarchaeum sp.]|nr:DUF1858 domain-containing protein [Candidatus ainarchaeum sp.]
MVSKKINLMELIDKHPETGYVLSSEGLGCAGCHASANETVEEGAKAHGKTNEEIKDLMNKINQRIKLFNTLEKIQFSEKAISELKERLNKSKMKYVRIFPSYGGFDFDTTMKILEKDIMVNKEPKIIVNKKLERFLRGITIDFNENDFIAKRKEIKE